MQRSKTPTSSCCGVATRVMRTRSSSITSSRACTTAPSCSSSTRVAPRRRSGPTCGSATTSAPTSPSATPSPARSSTPGWPTPSSSHAAPRASRSTRPRSRSGRSNAAARSPASRPTPSANWPTPTQRPSKAQMCWTLGITEHHNGVDNVLALINLALLCGHVGHCGSGLNPLRGQNNVQGGGDMGAIPNRLAGFQDILDPALRAKFEEAWGVSHPDRVRLAPHPDVRGDGARRPARRLRDRREPGTERGRQGARRAPACRVSIISSCKTSSSPRPPQLADVVLPGSASWCESEGTVTNSERRVQRCRKALDPPGEARDDIQIILDICRRLGNECATTANHRGRSPRRSGTRSVRCHRCMPG